MKKMNKAYTIFNIAVIGLFLFLMFMASGSPIPTEEKMDSDIPCQNLDVLDSVEEILHWEIINDTLHIYTIKDQIRDDRERWRYIDSLYKNE